jgi:HK97 family phage portal protein
MGVVILGSPNGDVSISGLRQVVQSPRARSIFGLGRTDSLSGAHVSREDAMGLPPFWSGVMLLAKTAGTLPLEVRDEQRDHQLISNADLSYRLRVQPNADTPAPVFWTTLFTHLIPAHNAYCLKLPAGDGLTYAPELFLIAPELVEKYRDDDGVIRYDLYTTDGGVFAPRVHSRHVLHLRGPAIHDTFKPTSMTSVARNSIGNALATQEYQGAMYRNGGVPKGVLSVDEPLTLEQGIEMADAWRAAYGGSENSGKIAVLDRGGKFQTVAMNNDNAQFIEQMQMSATDAARLLNIPPAFIGAEGSALTYDNAASNNQHLLKYGLRPWLDLVEGALNCDDDLFGVRSPWVPRFNTDEITRPDQETRYAGYQIAIAAGWMDPSEARAAEGLPPKPAQGEGLPSGTTDAPDAGGMDASTRSMPREQRDGFDGLHLTVNQAPVHVAPAEVRNEIAVEPAAAPVVHVSPEVRVDMPTQSAPEIVVNVPAQEPPVVNVDVAAPNVQVDVAAPAVRVEPQIHVEPAPSTEKRVKFQRNTAGNIIGAELTDEQ